MAHPDFSGSWKQVRTIGYEEGLKKIEIPKEIKEALKNFKHWQKVKQDGDKFEITSGVPSGQIDAVFTADGSQFEGSEHMGQKHKGVAYWKDVDTLCVETMTQGKKTFITRRLFNGELHQLMKIGDDDEFTIVLQKE